MVVLFEKPKENSDLKNWRNDVETTFKVQLQILISDATQGIPLTFEAIIIIIIIIINLKWLIANVIMLALNMLLFLSQRFT